VEYLHPLSETVISVGVPFKTMSEDKMRILWGSEQPTRPTGYGVVSRELIKRLAARGHEVFVMGWEYNGEPINHEEGWTLINAGLQGQGSDHINDQLTVLDWNLHTIKPDVYFSLTDIWATPNMVRSCNQASVPHVSYLPIDGSPFSYQWKEIIAMTHTPLWMSRFGQQQFEEFIEQYKSDGAGREHLRDPFLDRYDIAPTDVLYHGVDTEIFKPVSKDEKAKMREQLGVPQWEFVFLSVGRNGNRKQTPRLIEAFAMMLENISPEHRHKYGLILHTGDPTNLRGLGGWNLPQMVSEMGLEGNITFSDISSNPIHGLTREQMAKLYQVADCHVSATAGEGFGLPTIEAMACGLPVILPDNSTARELIGEKPLSRGILVENDTFITGPTQGVKLSVVSIEDLATQMTQMTAWTKKRATMAKKAREWVMENCDWNMLTDKLERILLEAKDQPHPHGNNTKVEHHA
jgi:D-inositol-3-phosphate glycosyltransferase